MSASFAVELPTLEEIRAERERRRAETERARLIKDQGAIRARCDSLHGFIEEHWSILEPKRPFVTGWALQAMCRHLEAVTDGKIQFLLMTVPPGMMKSLLLVFWTAWEWGPRARPDLQTLATSYSQANVLRDNLKLRRLIESDQYRALWPLNLRADQNAKGKFENTDNGFSEARPFSSMTGGRGDRVKVDDPHSTESAESDAERETAVRIFREGISDRMNDVQTSAIVIIMQRLHAKDVAAVALELDIGFVHLNLPMEFEAERVGDDGKVSGGPCRTYVDGVLFFEDPRTREGELLFPERFPLAQVAKLKKAKGSYAWAGQYQQRPSPRDGGIFLREWFKVAAFLPAGPKRTVRAWDIGATEGGGDPSAGVRCTQVGTDEEAGYYFTNSRTGQWSPAQLEAELKLTAAADTQEVTVRLPQDPGAAGKGYVQTLVNKLRGYAVKTAQPTGSKVTRATALATQAEAGNVFILTTGDPTRDAWIEPFIEELCSFPSGTHDDQVDAAADAFNELALNVPAVLDIDSLL
ncbi:phage terminase large subunit [Brevundimonas sp. NIBR11]|uniref:phage terminase large subunit n=1 Tax=Brevundimonas sp. NIBR11 TaxID=3015999 RepID=UPI0022F0ACD9|nr:phage terminase large subunit [Brevundimonas sp. NIBR11]